LDPLVISTANASLAHGAGNHQDAHKVLNVPFATLAMQTLTGNTRKTVLPA